MNINVILLIVLAVLVAILIVFNVLLNKKKVKKEKIQQAENNLKGLFNKKNDGQKMEVTCSSCGSKVETYDGDGRCPYCGAKIVKK